MILQSMLHHLGCLCGTTLQRLREARFVNAVEGDVLPENTALPLHDSLLLSLQRRKTEKLPLISTQSCCSLTSNLLY